MWHINIANGGIFMEETIIKEDGEIVDVKSSRERFGEHILDELLLNAVKNKKAILEMVIQKNPGMDKKKLWIAINSTISALKKYTKYEWDDENFMLKKR
jgi:hypothetical protein